MWYGLKIDGEVRYVMQRDEKPTDRDFHLVFGIAITPSSQYEVVEVFVYEDQRFPPAMG
jgi:hypothetical protein